MIAVTHGMVLAAGLGLRMRPLTDDRPKALVELRGLTLLDRALGQLRRAGVARLVVNAHYQGAQIHAHLSSARDIAISDEAELLDTGGGVAQALPHLGDNAFFVVNCDSVWIDDGDPALARLAAAFGAEAMDALLLVQPVAHAIGYEGPGDFRLGPDGRVVRRTVGGTAPYVFTGVQLLHPRLFEGAGIAPFSLNLLYDRAASAGRLHGLVHQGRWFHVGTPEQLALAEQKLTASHAQGPANG